MKEDNDLVNNAIDAAFEKAEAKDENLQDKEVPENTKEEDTPDEASEVTPEATQEEVAESNKESDEEAIAETEDQSPTENVVETVSAPAILSAATKALWNKVPADVQKALAADALKTQQHISRLANESQRAKAWDARVNSDFQSKEDLDAHKAQLRLNRINDEVEELHNYRAWSKVLKNDPLTAVREIIATHGITPEELNGTGFSEESEAAAHDPRVDQVIEELKAEREAREQAKKHAETQAIAAQVNQWKSGNDKYGKPRSEFAGQFAPQIDAEFQRLIQEAGQLGVQKELPEFLDEAFENVQTQIYSKLGINPQKPTKTAEQIAADTAKAKAASSKALGAPRTDVITKRPQKEYKNDKERVEAAIQRAEEKISGSNRYR